uniref:Retroviral polymerase SH3-like domain-containing protein n=1 Tax=Tanacetum cinerariifolium TaxID=118510 RepID=A0A6L2JEK0_TANCI|nr:hypothetical protein [Tanacetum cinerariifolium]
MRIEQYFLMTNYSLWEVILNGDSPVSTIVVDGVVQPVSYKSAEQKLARRNEQKACAIEKRFGGNTKTKKVQKTLLKQQFENFTGSSFENLDRIHNRLQKLVSQLEIHRMSLFQEDVNLKFLCSLPFEWKTHTLIWRNKADLEEHSLDDLFNSLKIYKAEVKHSSSTGNPTQNLAFMSSSNTDSTANLVSAATSVFAVCAKLHVSSHPNIDSLSNAVIYSFFASQSTNPQLDNEDLKQIDAEILVMIELHLWVLICQKWSVITATERDILLGSVGLLRTQEGCYDWSYQAEEEPANFALMAITSSSSSSDNEPVEAPILDATLSPKSNGSSKRKNRKTCFVCRSVDHLIKDCDYHAKKRLNPHEGNIHTGPKPVSITTVRPVCADVPKIMVTRPRHAHPIDTKSKSPITRHITCSPSPKTSNSPPKVTAAYALVVSAAKGKKGKWVWRPKCPTLDHDFRTINTLMILKQFDYNDALGRSKSDKGVIDIGCSWYMTWNMSYLSDFEELNGGYVAFGGNPNGGKISGKGKIKTGKFEEKFDEGYLVGYSINSKVFTVFNSRARIVQETLHVNFLENKPNIAGSGSTWLFDIDSLTRTMNYQPVTAGNQSNPSADRDAAFDGKEHEVDTKKPESAVNVSPSSKFEDHSDNSSNDVNAAGSIVPTSRQNSSNSTNPFSAACPLNTNASPTYGKFSFNDASQLPDNPDMLEIEDIT